MHKAFISGRRMLNIFVLNDIIWPIQGEEGRRMIDFLKEERVNSDVIGEIKGFRADYLADAGDQGQAPAPKYQYYGWETWRQAATALLCSQNLLLTRPRVTGKSILAESLAAAFGCPL